MDNIASFIDHTLLKPEATKDQILKLCSEALEYKFKTVCINPSYISIAKDKLSGSDVGICTVIGFPLGAMTTEAKAFETKDAISKGATEVDMVINIGRLQSSDYEYVQNDIKAVVNAANNTPVKVILETALLSEDQILKASRISSDAGASFVKTSTGFSTRGASLADIKIMKANIDENVKIKASGGIRDFETAKSYIDLGVSRLGTSSGVAIINNTESKSAY